MPKLNRSLRIGSRGVAQATLRVACALLAVVFITQLGNQASAQPAEYSEAPPLEAQVTAGELPPVEERLPENPLVIEPLEQIGEYGGTWNDALIGATDGTHIAVTIGYDSLVRWNPDWTEIIPNLAESFEVSEDATVYTFRLREGVKWSDGQPFTADDIMFWYEAVILNEDLSEIMTAGLETAPEFEVEKIDDYTVRFTLPEPNGLFLEGLATSQGNSVLGFPRHYLAQFHADYNTDTLEQLVEENGVEDWIALFDQQSSSTEAPTLNAWKITTPYDGSSTRVVAERNPYYWKVDPEGNQLPYIDRVVYRVVQEADVLVLNTLNGEIDMNLAVELQDVPVYADGREEGNYHFIELIPTDMNTTMIALNLTHQDPVKREIFQNKDFRIGLSHAINRQEIIDLVFVGQGEPWQAAPRPESDIYHEQLAKQYTEYDVALANEHLDLAGYTERDSEGFRLGPDGQRISFGMLIRSDRPYLIDVFGLVRRHFAEVGVDMQLNVVERSFQRVQTRSNEHDASTDDGEQGMRDAFLDPRWYVPLDNGSLYGIAWYYAFAGSEDEEGAGIAEEPPAPVARQFELYRQLQAEPNDEEQLELMNDILDIAAGEFYAIGISLPPNQFGIVSNRLRNVPDTMINSFRYPTPGPTRPEQYFISDAQ